MLCTVRWDWTTNSSISNSKKNGSLENAMPSRYSLTNAIGNIDFIGAGLFSPSNVIELDSSKVDRTKGWTNATHRLWPIGDILRACVSVWERTSENEAEVFMTLRFIIAILFLLLSRCVSLCFVQNLLNSWKRNVHASCCTALLRTRNHQNRSIFAIISVN